MTDGILTKEYQVTNLVITEVDLLNDTVSGTAEPGSDVNVQGWADPDYCEENVSADGSGDWSADFSGDCDLTPVSAYSANQTDTDGDMTIWIVWPSTLTDFDGDLKSDPAKFDASTNFAIQVFLSRFERIKPGSAQNDTTDSFRMC